MSSSAIQVLKAHNLRKTPFRVKVLELFMGAEHKALSNADIESELDEFDRITLYRTLRSFEKSGIIHQAIDSSNDTKFAYCHDDCTAHEHRENHAHFLCSGCGHTYCIDNVIQNSFRLPQKFRLDNVHIALEGTCAKCA